MDMTMTFYNILCLIGVSGIFGALWRHLAQKVKYNREDNEAIKKGIQVLLRDRLNSEYRHYAKQGWADIDERACWEAMYEQYHTLGKNGVMDSIREKFLNLPTEQPSEE